MSIEATGSAQRRPIENDPDFIVEAPKNQTPAPTPRIEDAYDRIAAAPTTVPQTPAAKGHVSVADTLAKVKQAIAAVKAARAEGCAKQDAAVGRLQRDMKALLPQLEKLEKDLEALAKKLGPAAKDVVYFASGLYDVYKGVKGLCDGIEKWPEGTPEILEGAYDLGKGLEHIAEATEHWDRDKELAKSAGPELEALKRDFKAMHPGLVKVQQDAKDVGAHFRPTCIIG